MLSADSLVLYYIRLNETFHQYASRTLQSFKPDDVHHLRTAMKRIRCILLLMENTDGHYFHARAHIVLFAPLFSATGKLRDRQLNRSLIEQFDLTDLQQLIDWLDQKERVAKVRVMTHLEYFGHAELASANGFLIDQICAHLQGGMTATIQQFIVRQVAKATKKADCGFSERHLHQIRILLRRADDMRQLLNDCADLPFDTSAQSLHHTTRIIGTWHDYETLMAAVMGFVEELQPGKKCRALLGELITNIDLTRRQYQDEAIVAVDELLGDHRWQEAIRQLPG